MIKRTLNIFISKNVAERLLNIAIIATGAHLLIGLMVMLYTLLFNNPLAGIGIIFFHLLPTIFWLGMSFLLKGCKNKSNIIFIVISCIFFIISVLFLIAYIFTSVWPL